MKYIDPEDYLKIKDCEFIGSKYYGTFAVVEKTFVDNDILPLIEKNINNDLWPNWLKELLDEPERIIFTYENNHHENMKHTMILYFACERR